MRKGFGWALVLGFLMSLFVETDRTYPDVQSLLLLSALFDTTVDELIKGDVSKMEETCKHDWALMQRLGIGMTIFAILGIAAFFIAFLCVRPPLT